MNLFGDDSPKETIEELSFDDNLKMMNHKYNIKPYIKYNLSDVNKSSNRKRFTVISTFSGGGGSSIGYKLGGGDVLTVNEFVEEAVSTYLSNFEGTNVLCGDIKDFTPEDFITSSGIGVGDLDILDGSPPCSAFSLCGKGSDGWGKEKKYSDGKIVNNIEDLFFEYIRIANGLQPKVIVAENVPGLLVGKSKKKFNEIVVSLKSCGYVVTAKTLMAQCYGVAQRRERLIFVCVRNDVAESLGIDDFNLSSLVFPVGWKSNTFVSTSNAIDDIYVGDEEKSMLAVTGEILRWSVLIPKNQTKILSGSDVHPKGSYFSLCRCSPFLPCPTLTQRGVQTNVAGVIHYNEDRKFSIDELKRLQGLPDDLVLTGKFNQQAERIGRMVAPKMYESLSNKIYDNVIKPFNDMVSK